MPNSVLLACLPAFGHRGRAHLSPRQYGPREMVSEVPAYPEGGNRRGRDRDPHPALLPRQNGPAGREAPWRAEILSQPPQSDELQAPPSPEPADRKRRHRECLPERDRAPDEAARPALGNGRWQGHPRLSRTRQIATLRCRVACNPPTPGRIARRQRQPALKLAQGSRLESAIDQKSSSIMNLEFCPPLENRAHSNHRCRELRCFSGEGTAHFECGSCTMTFDAI